MGDLTKDTPKPLLIDSKTGKTLLEERLEELPDQISEIIIVVGYKGEQIKEKIGNEFNQKKITYVTQDDLNGTAGALYTAKDILHDDFLVIAGDDKYKKHDLEKLISSQHDTAILASKIDTNIPQKRYGILKVSGDTVIDVVENQKAEGVDLVNTGAYKLNDTYFGHDPVRAGNDSDEMGLPQTVIKMGDTGVVEAEDWSKVDYPEDLQ